MAEQDVFEFSAKYDVEIEKSSMDQACKVLDDFYNKYHDRKMKIDTSDMIKAARDGVSKIQKLYKQGMDAIAKDDIAWFDVEDGLDKQLKSARSKFEKFFSEAKIMFSDGSMLSVLDENVSDILSEKFSKGIVATVASLEEPIGHIKSLIDGALQYLEAFGNFKVNWDGTKQFTAFQEDMDTAGLAEHIKLLKELVVYQKQLELVSGEAFKAKNAPLGNTTDSIEKQIVGLDKFLSNMERYNQKVEEQYKLTTNQFKQRQQILATLQNSDWSDDQQARAIVESERDGDYDAYIDIIKRHIETKQNAIRQMNELQSELFRVDNISEITSDVKDEISRYEQFIKQLEDKRDAKLNIPVDFSEVVTALNEIKDAIREIKDAFDPLTQAFANEESAIHAMVTSNVSQLEDLINKFKEVHNMVDELNRKDFSVTNVYNQKTTQSMLNSAQLDAYKEKANETLNVIKMLSDAVSKSQHAGKVLFSDGKATKYTELFTGLFGTKGQFNEISFVEKIAGADTLSKIKKVVSGLDSYKAAVLDAAQTINAIEADAIDISFLDVLDKIDEKIKAAGKIDVKGASSKQDTNIETSTGSDSALNQIKSLRDQVVDDFTAIRKLIEKTFDFSTLDPNITSVQTITDKIYQQFVELQDKIKALDFKIEAPNMDGVVNAINVIKQEGEAAEGATPKKDAFTAANQKVAVSMQETGDAGKVAADGVKAEADAVEEATKTFNNAGGLFTSAETIAAQYKSSGRIWDELSRSTLESRSKLISDSFNKYISTAGINVSDIDTSFLDKSYKKDDGSTDLYEVVKLVAKGTDAAGKVVTIIQEYNMASAALEKESTKFHDAINKFDLVTAKSTAQSQIQELKSQMGSFKIDIGDLETAQGGIIDEDSFDVFNEKLKNAKQRLAEIKTMLKSSKSLDPLVNSDNMMSNLETTVKTYRENIKKFADVEGFDKLGGSLDAVTDKLKEFNEAKDRKDGNAMAQAVAEINKEIANYNSQLNLVKARHQENNRVAKETAAEEKKRLAEEEAAWKEYNAAKEAESQKERDIDAAYRSKLAQEALEDEKALLQARKEADAFYEQEEKTRKAQEDAAWAEYRAEQEAAAEKERQINLAFSQKAAQEAAEAEKELAQARKEANEYFTAVEKQEQKEEEAKKVKELNALYRERNTIITAIIKYNNKAETLKTDKAIQRAKDQLELEKQRLTAIDEEIDKYGELINVSKLEQQNDRLTSRLRDSNVTNFITKEQKQDIEDVNRSLERRKEVHDNILKLQKQLNDASGDEERKAIQQEIDGQNTIYKALTKKLALYKDIALQRKVTEQDNKFREQDNWNQIQKNINAAADADNAELEYQKQNYKDILSLVEQLFDAQTALYKINTDPTDKVHTAEREKEIEKVKELSMLLKDIYGIDVENLTGSLDKNILLTQEQKNKLLEKEREYKQDILDLTAKAADQEATQAQRKANKEAQSYGQADFNKLTKFSESVHTSIRELQSGGTVGATLKNLVAEFDVAYSKVEAMRKQFIDDPSAMTPEMKTQFQDSVRNAENLRQKITDVFKESQKLQKLGSLITTGDRDVSQVENLKSEMIAFANSTLDGEVKIKGFNKEGNQMYVTLNQGAGAVENITVALDKASGHLQAFSTGTSKATNEWEEFKTQAVAGAKNLVGMYVGFQEGVQAVRKGVEYVKEIDLAMTELKKVTDETDVSYKQFLKDAGSTSAVIGSTISDFTEATATFARLGYSMEESSSMAETAIIYKNVADGLDSVEESSDSIISTMMAFGIEANDTMSIIDRFNAVGNNFAITSAGIGEALQRSASALFSAGNTIDESVALVTAANSVIQNPEQVGTALKTLALRLRGAKTELEEAGLETDNMAESTSTLQAKLNALTHGKVDIMLDADTFKSTTQILREMSAAWEDMTDIERAAALELMGGKRQANILSSVIQNFETVEDVITTSMNSSGSAIAENEKWLDSIEGKTYQFTNALQTMWSNMLNSEVIKGFLDFGTGAIQFLDTGAGKVIALVAALKLMAKFKGFSIKGIAQGLGDTIQNITKAQQTLQNLSANPATKIGVGYDLTNINAYAQAVSNLTAKQQANLLASSGLNREQIKQVLTINQVDEAAQREAMAHVKAASAKQQSAAADKALFQEKMAYAAQSLAIEAKSTGSATKQAAADFLKANASRAATAEEMKELIATSNLTAAEKAEAMATVQQTIANKGLAASIKAIYTANPVGFWITLASTILSLIPVIAEVVGAVTKSADEIKQEAQEITQTYTNAVNEINSNFQSLGITNDAASIGDLEKEFATLTAGVDKYGNNLSLTSDQYERYRDICEQIVGINPLIASGYDSATEAIGNNANVLSQLIELQKEQARIAAEDYLSDENLEILSQDAVNDYADASVKNSQRRAEALKNVSAEIRKSFNEYYKENPDLLNDGMGINYHEMKWTLEQIGYTADEAAQKLQDYYIAGEYHTTLFYNDFINEIKDNVSAFGDEYTLSISKSIVEAESEFAAAEEQLSKARDGLIDTLLVAPASSKDYGKLTSEGKNFLVEWIKNSEMFKVDGELNEEDVKAMKETILNMMDIIVSDAKNIEYNGEKFTAQDLLSKIYNLDPSSIDYSDYKKQLNEMLTAFWDSLSAEQKKAYGFEKFEDFTISLGFDFVTDEKAETKMVKRYAKIKGITEEKAEQYFASLPAIVVKRLLQVDWDTVDEGNVDDTINGAQYKQPESSKTYSVLAESVESYNEILAQTSEIAADNTEVTQEYKDSLKDLGISEEELSECFDKNNGLVVKNAKALNQLVKAANKNVAANVKLAKSNVRLEYYDLVKQLNGALDGTKNLNAATRDSVYSTLEQIDAVNKALYQYQLLEDTLLGVNNAFKDFNDAKEIDALNTYGDSYVEMVQTMYDGLYKTGQVGTEQFRTAVEHLVPDEVYQGLKEDSDRMKAIYDYYNEYILPSLNLDEDKFSMDYKSVENFVDKALDADVFKGDKENFDLVEGMNLEKAAELMKMTKTQAYAFFAELDKYNTGLNEHSFLSQLDDSLDGQITNITNDIEDLNRAKLALLEDGGYENNKEAIDDINSKLSQSESELNKLGEQAYKTWQQYTDNEAVIAALEAVEDKTKYLTEPGAQKLGLEWDEVKGHTIQQVLDSLLAKQLELGEPTTLTATLAIDTIDSEIATLKSKIEEIEADPTVVINPDQQIAQAREKIQELKNDKVEIATQFNIELSEEEKKDLQSQLNAIEQFTINDKTFNVVANGAQESLQELQDIQNFALNNKSYTVTEYRQILHKPTLADPDGDGVVGVNGTAHARGTAYKNGSWGAPRTETALVGELGPEILVRNGRWHTIGDNGAEFTQIKKGDIIFNHKQTEDLLSKGYVTGRGKLHGGAFASGTAYSGLWKPTSPDTSQSNEPGNDFSDAGNRLFDASDSISDAADSISSSASDAADEFREVFDWIEVRLEEINKDIDYKNAQLENKIGHSAQNKVIDKIIDLNKKLYENLIAGSEKYYDYANNLLSKVPEEYREAAQDGTIAIEEFVGEADEKTLDAIKEYREWVQKGDEAAQKAEETLTEISNLAKQAIDNIAGDYDNQRSLRDNELDQYDAYNALLETDKGFESEYIYKKMIDANNTNIEMLEKQRNDMQAELNKRVESGEIQKFSQDWYDAVNDIAAVDTEIIELKTDTENYQDVINELHWEKFDVLVKMLSAVSEEADNLIDILSNKDLVDEGGNWTGEGITSLGLYAQKMEAAEVQAKKYEEEIAYLNDNWQELGYTEEEYIDKLDELKSGQYDAIQSYHDAKDAIVDLNKERVEAIKKGIEKEIDAYSELIDKKKEALDVEKDLYDFKQNVTKQEKNIADLQRQLKALEGNNTAAARAKKAQLEAELAEAQAELQDSYYDRSISNQQEALDKELENFKNEKDEEIKGWDEYLENTEQVVADSLETVKANTDTVYQTLLAMGQEYGLSITESLTAPWKEGESAIQSFSEKFGISMSATVEELIKLEQQFKDAMLEIEQAGKDAADSVIDNTKKYTDAEYKEPEKPQEPEKPKEEEKQITIGGKINAGNARIYASYDGTGGGKQYFDDDPIYTVLDEKNGYLLVRYHKAKSGATGWFKKSDVKAYAKGTTNLKESGILNVDELGEELLVRAQNGRLTYMEKGSGIVPADLTANLMKWGKLDPSIMLDQNRPAVGLHPEIHNTQIQIDNSIAELIHIDHCDQSTLPDVEKIVNKALEKHTQKLNQSLRKYTR